MRTAPTCPRCGGPVREPNAWSSAWQCDVHGEVHPLRMAYSTSAEGLEGLLRGAAVPVWLPWPLAPEGAAFGGEMMGNGWWLILGRDPAGMLLVEPLELRDLRDPGQDLDLPFGAPSPMLPS